MKMIFFAMLFSVLACSNIEEKGLDNDNGKNLNQVELSTLCEIDTLFDVFTINISKKWNKGRENGWVFYTRKDSSLMESFSPVTSFTLMDFQGKSFQENIKGLKQILTSNYQGFSLIKEETYKESFLDCYRFAFGFVKDGISVGAICYVYSNGSNLFFLLGTTPLDEKGRFIYRSDFDKVFKSFKIVESSNK